MPSPTTRTLRQNMPIPNWDRLDTLARRDGVSIGQYSRDVLIMWAALPDDVMMALTRDARAHEMSPLDRVKYLLTRKYRKGAS